MKTIITIGTMGMAILMAVVSVKTALGQTLTSEQIAAMHARIQESMTNIMPPTPPPISREMRRRFREAKAAQASASPLDDPMEPMGQQSSTPPIYAVIDLGDLGGGSSQALGINASGQVVGWSNTSSGSQQHAFLWKNGIIQDLGTFGGNASFAYGINDNGQVVGTYLNTDNGNIAFLWQNGIVQNLGAWSDYYSIAYGINDNGQVVGAYVNAGTYKEGGFLWHNGIMLDIGTLGGNDTLAYGVNNEGQVAGASDGSDNQFHAFLWQNGSMQNLGQLGGAFSWGNGINDNGQVVGYAGTTTTDDAFLWQDGSMQDLGRLAGAINSQAYGINDNGQVVGFCFDSNYNELPFLWQNGSMYNLNSLLFNADSGWTLEEATAINNNGQIVGYGINHLGQTHAFLLNPLPAGSVPAASTVQTSLPEYGICPVPGEGQNSLVFITHGWINPDIETVSQAVAFVNTMSNSIAQHLAGSGFNNWKVQGYLWTNLADIPVHDGGPSLALIRAEQQGKMIGDSIVQAGYTDIHFIAHSAGAGMIQKATEEIKATSLVPVTIHCTFLDAYDGVYSEMAYEYGAEAEWADSYFVRDEFQKYGWTGVVLPNAYNVDVTTLDPSSGLFPWYESLGLSCSELESNHGWPPNFYQNSIENVISGSSIMGYNGFGFPLSEEAGMPIDSLKDEYPPGNGVLYGSVTDLGPDSGCIPPYVIPSQYIGTVPGFTVPSTIKSSTGTLQTSPGTAKVGTGSPVWIATVITDTNALNYVSFDAEFTSAVGADGLLTVYWDTNMIGEVDEAAVLPGLQHYNMQFQNTVPNTSHVLGFHVDPFTEVHSTLVLTNIVTGCVGVSQPPTLTVTTNRSGNQLVYQLTGQIGAYAVQSSGDLLNWTTIAYLANTNGAVNFVDENSTNYHCQFYRAISPGVMSQ